LGTFRAQQSDKYNLNLIICKTALIKPNGKTREFSFAYTYLKSHFAICVNGGMEDYILHIREGANSVKEKLGPISTLDVYN
jgi:hypothetical protein